MAEACKAYAEAWGLSGCSLEVSELQGYDDRNWRLTGEPDEAPATTARHRRRTTLLTLSSELVALRTVKMGHFNCSERGRREF